MYKRQVLDILNHFREAHPSVRPMMSNGNCKIQLYGDQMRELCGVAASVVSAVAQSGADLMLITTSEVMPMIILPAIDIKDGELSNHSTPYAVF